MNHNFQIRRYNKMDTCTKEFRNVDLKTTKLRQYKLSGEIEAFLN